MALKQLPPFAAIVILLSGCTHNYYSPNTANVPVFKEKNEVHASASLVTNGQNVGGDIQAAYAVTNCIGVLANANINSGGTDSSGGKGYLFEIGAGYYKPLNVNTKHAKNLFVFEAYGALGMGGYRNFYWDSSGQIYPNLFGETPTEQYLPPNNRVTIRYIKAYVQPSISFSHNIFDFIVASKIGFLHTYSVTSTIAPAELTSVPPAGGVSYSPYWGTLYGDWQTLNTARTPFLIEPSFTTRLGFKWVKVQWQVTFTPNHNTFLNNVALNPWAISIGISVDIAHRFKKQPKHASGNEIDYN